MVCINRKVLKMLQARILLLLLLAGGSFMGCQGNQTPNTEAQDKIKELEAQLKKQKNEKAKADAAVADLKKKISEAEANGGNPEEVARLKAQLAEAQTTAAGQNTQLSAANAALEAEKGKVTAAQAQL